MRLVIVESPYADADPARVAANLAYARAAVKDCLERGESPIASHLLLTQDGILDDEVPSERALGMRAGLAWSRACDAAVFYVDRGWSPGMLDALEAHRAGGKEIVVREIVALEPESGAAPAF